MRILELEEKYYVEHNSFCVIYNPLVDEKGNHITKEEFLRRRAVEEQRNKQQLVRKQQVRKSPPLTIEESRERLKKLMPQFVNTKSD
jgi:hypothetical protein